MVLLLDDGMSCLIKISEGVTGWKIHTKHQKPRHPLAKHHEQIPDLFFLDGGGYRGLGVYRESHISVGGVTVIVTVTVIMYFLLLLYESTEFFLFLLI